jgi:hypothetical protein
LGNILIHTFNMKTVFYCFVLSILLTTSLHAQSVTYTFEGFKTGCIQGDCVNGKGILAFAILYDNPTLKNGIYRHIDSIGQGRGVLAQVGYLAGEFNNQTKEVKGKAFSSLEIFLADYTDHTKGTNINLYRYSSAKKNNRGPVLVNDNLRGGALRFYNGSAFTSNDFFQFEGLLRYENLTTFYNQKGLTFSDANVKSFFYEKFHPIEGVWRENHADKTFEGIFHHGFPHRGTVKVNDKSQQFHHWNWKIIGTEFTHFFGIFDYASLNPNNRTPPTFIPRRGKFSSTLTETIISGAFVNDFSSESKTWKISPIGPVVIMDNNQKPQSIKVYAKGERLFTDQQGKDEFIDLYDHALPYVAQRVKLPMYTDSLWYEGQVKNNVPHGLGQVFFKMQLNNDSITAPEEFYWGFFKDGVPHGPGSYIVFPNIPNQLVGIYEHGNIVYGDDGKYVGQFLAGKYHGHGKYADINLHANVRYEGSFAHGEFSGQGSWSLERFSMGNSYFDTYIGNFEKGKFNGKGIYTDPKITKDGLFAEGNFIEGTVTQNPLLTLSPYQVVTYRCGGSSGKHYVKSVNATLGTVTLGNDVVLGKNCNVTLTQERSDQFFKTCGYCQGTGVTSTVKHVFSGYYTRESTVYRGSTISGDYIKTTITPIYETHTQRNTCSLCNGAGRVHR